MLYRISLLQNAQIFHEEFVLNTQKLPTQKKLLLLPRRNISQAGQIQLSSSLTKEISQLMKAKPKGFDDKLYGIGSFMKAFIAVISKEGLQPTKSSNKDFIGLLSWKISWTLFKNMIDVKSLLIFKEIYLCRSLKFWPLDHLTCGESTSSDLS